MTCDELREQIAGLVQPTPYEERTVNVAYESDLWRTILAQGYMCYTHSCQFEAQILTYGAVNKAYCCYEYHADNATSAHGSDLWWERYYASLEARRLELVDYVFAATPTPTPSPTPTPPQARASRPSRADAGASGGANVAASAGTFPASSRGRSPPARRRQQPTVRQHSGTGDGGEASVNAAANARRQAGARLAASRARSLLATRQQQHTVRQQHTRAQRHRARTLQKGL